MFKIQKIRLALVIFFSAASFLLLATEMNELAMRAPIGADGITFVPFGNGAERIMENHDMGASLSGLNFNRHGQEHLPPSNGNSSPNWKRPPPT